MEGATKLTPTSPIRFASGFFGIYFDRSPAGMRAETSCGGEMVAPRRGRMFGWFKLFHIMASLQNIFGFVREYAYRAWWYRQRTLVENARASGVATRKRLTQTGEPSSVARYTSPKEPEANGFESTIRRWEGIEQDVGRVVWAAHMLPSSRKHLREAGPEGSRLSRAY